MEDRQWQGWIYSARYSTIGYFWSGSAWSFFFFWRVPTHLDDTTPRSETWSWTANRHSILSLASNALCSFPHLQCLATIDKLISSSQFLDSKNSVYLSTGTAKSFYDIENRVTCSYSLFSAQRGKHVSECQKNSASYQSTTMVWCNCSSSRSCTVQDVVDPWYPKF